MPTNTDSCPFPPVNIASLFDKLSAQWNAERFDKARETLHEFGSAIDRAELVVNQKFVVRDSKFLEYAATASQRIILCNGVPPYRKEHKSWELLMSMLCQKPPITFVMALGRFDSDQTAAEFRDVFKRLREIGASGQIRAMQAPASRLAAVCPGVVPGYILGELLLFDPPQAGLYGTDAFLFYSIKVAVVNKDKPDETEEGEGVRSRFMINLGEYEWTLGKQWRELLQTLKPIEKL